MTTPPETMTVTCDLWYADTLGVKQLPVRGWLRSWDLWRASRGGLIVTKLERETFPLAILVGLTGKRRLVFLEMQNAPYTGLIGLLVRLVAPLVGRGVLVAQVLSTFEIEACAKQYGIAKTRIAFIPWPLEEADPPTQVRGEYVLASGRACVDWETFFKAIDGSTYPVTVVCGGHDLLRVVNLMLETDAEVEVLVDIPRPRHHQLMKGAAVYVLPLVEQHVSCGQIRLMEARGTMTPLVVTHVRGLQDYYSDHEIVVTPGDVKGLSQAIDEVLGHRALAIRKARISLEGARGWCKDNYLQAIRDLAH